jgi:hypothetical protein
MSLAEYAMLTITLTAFAVGLHELSLSEKIIGHLLLTLVLTEGYLSWVSLSPSVVLLIVDIFWSYKTSKPPKPTSTPTTAADTDQNVRYNCRSPRPLPSPPPSPRSIPSSKP